MSSLRPLLTILLLAAVGVVLYMKINESEPVVPAGVGEWTAGPLDIGGGAVTAGSSTSTSPPKYATDAAPALTPGAAAPTGGASAPSGEDAPSWSPGPAAVSEPPKAAATASPGPDSSPVARTAEPHLELPAMPALPGAIGKNEAPKPASEGQAIAGPGVDAPKFDPSAQAQLATADQTTPSKPADAASSEKSDIASATPSEAPQTAATEPTSPAPATDPITPTDANAEAPAASPPPLYPSVRVAVQAELERGELAQALLRLSDWYGDPSLTPAERQEVDTWLSQLAGSVIWEGPPAHRLEPAHIVQSGETLQDIGEKYDVPWQLLAKINGIADPAALQPGQQLKVIRGKFSAIVDLSERTMTLFLDRRYAGKFAIELDPTTAIEEGQWKVDQKLLTPTGGVYGSASGATEDRSLLLANPADPAAQAAVLRGPGSNDPASPQPAGRVIRLKSAEVNDVYDILSVGSKVTIRR